MRRCSLVVAWFVLPLLGAAEFVPLTAEQIVRQIETHEARFAYCEIVWQQMAYNVTADGRKPAQAGPLTVTARCKGGWQYVLYETSAPPGTATTCVHGEGWTLTWMRDAEHEAGIARWGEDEIFGMGVQDDFAPFRRVRQIPEPIEIVEQDETSVRIQLVANAGTMRWEGEFRRVGDELEPVRTALYTRPGPDRAEELYSTSEYRYERQADGSDALRAVEIGNPQHGMAKVYEVQSINLAPDFGSEGFDPGLAWRTRIEDPATGRRLWGERDLIEDWLSRAGTEEDQPEEQAVAPAPVVEAEPGAEPTPNAPNETAVTPPRREPASRVREERLSRRRVQRAWALGIVLALVLGTVAFATTRRGAARKR